MKFLKRLLVMTLAVCLLATCLPVSALDASNYQYNDATLQWRDDFLWGAQMHTRNWSSVYNSGSIMERVHLAAEMGLNLIRIDGTAEDERDLDDAVRLCNAYGIKVMMICYFDYDFYNPCSAQKAAEITEHARSMAERYNGKNGCGKVDFIQLSNEVDCDFIVRQCEEMGVGHPSGADRNWYNDTYMANVATYFRAAVAGIKQVEDRAQTIINFSYWHYGFLTGMLEEGVDFDIIGHDWYLSMYRPATRDYYNGIGNALIQNFDKPIIICEGNINPSQDDVASEETDITASSWNSLIECLWQAYPMEQVIGWNFYEFIDEPERQTQNGGNYTGEAHFGLVKLVNGVYTPKPIYYRLRQLIGGNKKTVEKKYVTAPLKRNTYDVVVDCPSVDIKGYRNSSDNTFFSKTDYLKYGSFGKNVNITSADYIEFDIFSTVSRNLSIALGSVTSNEYYEARSKKYNFSVSDGWTHVVVPINLLQEADLNSASGYNPRNANGIIIFDNGSLSDELYLHVTNFNLTDVENNAGFTNPLIDHLPNFTLSKYIPKEVTTIYNQVAYRLFGYFERKFDISNANYVEFDVYIDNPCDDLTLWLCNSMDGYGRRRYTVKFSQLTPNQWNHVVVDLRKDYTGTHGTMNLSNLTTIFFEGDPSQTHDVTITISNFGVTKSEPNMKNKHVSIGEVEGLLSSVTVPKNTNMYPSYKMSKSLGVALDSTKAEFIELDIYSSGITKEITFWMCNAGDSKGRIRQNVPSLKKGWNHVVIPINWNAYQYGQFNPTNFNSYFFEHSPSATEDITLMVANLAITVEEKAKTELEFLGGVVSRYNGYDYKTVPPSTDISSAVNPIELPVALDIQKIDYIEMSLYINSKNDVTVNLNSTPRSEGEIYSEAAASYTLSNLNYGWNNVKVPVDMAKWGVNEWFDGSAVNYIYLSGTLSNTEYTFITVENLALTSKDVSSPLNEGDYNYDGNVDMLDLVHTVNGSLSDNSLWFANVAEISSVKNGLMDAQDVIALRKHLFSVF